VAALTAVVGVGVLAMHILVVPGDTTGVHATMGTHATMGMHAAHTAAGIPAAATHVMAHGSAAGGALVDAVPGALGRHAHELLGCLWLIAAAVLVVAARRLVRLGREATFRRDPTWWDRATQRAPPLSTRLALVGVALR
jgi:dienelactone hydrolase